MARPRTPSNVLELRGAYKRHPERREERAGEPEPQGEIGPAPAHLDEMARQCWEEVVSIAPIGVLGDCDRLHLEVVAELLALKRTVGIEAIDPAKLNRLDAMLGKLGLNPADRSKVKVAKTGTSANPFDGF